MLGILHTFSHAWYTRLHGFVAFCDNHYGIFYASLKLTE